MTLAPAADHVLAVLSLLARRPEPLAAASIAEQLQLPRSTVYRLLGVLSDRGFVTHLPEERVYGLGLAAYELGSAYQRQAPLQRLARPVVRRLVDATQQNAHLAVLRGSDVVYVLEERAPGRPSLVTDVGVRLPALRTASGRAILARLPTRQVRATYPHAEALDGAVPTLADLRTLLARTRRRGYATEEGSVTPGLSSVAQGVLDHADHPAAAIALTYVAASTTKEEVQGLVDALARAAGQLSRRLLGPG
ncbi:MAG TPA: IclR family transcriptional regulator [Friedmanniella sp.]